MALTDVAIRKAAPGEKPYKLSDGRGLYLLVATKGAKSRRFKYGFGGKELLLTFMSVRGDVPSRPTMDAGLRQHDIALFGGTSGHCRQRAFRALTACRAARRR